MSHTLDDYRLTLNAKLHSVVACPQPPVSRQSSGQRFGSANVWPIQQSFHQTHDAGLDRSGQQCELSTALRQLKLLNLPVQRPLADAEHLGGFFAVAADQV